MKLITVVIMVIVVSAGMLEKTDEKALSRPRQRRQLFLYLCGFTYSYYPCYYPCPTCYTYYRPYQPYVPPAPQPPPQPRQECIGPCVNAQCPAGYQCNANNVCCRNV